MKAGRHRYGGRVCAQSLGFSLIELLIVVAIILILAAIAIPNFLRARMSANEASAVSSVHGLNTGEAVYNTLYPAIGYSVHLGDLGPDAGGNCPDQPTASCVVPDPALTAGNKSGYAFTYVADLSVTPCVHYTLNADPSVQAVTGNRHYYSDESNEIHYNLTAVAGPNDPEL
jgi:prepilin-type N-terminal cleavage/methylation domain-containing protein